MKILVYNGKGKLKEKLWGDFACVHVLEGNEFTVQGQNGAAFYSKRVKMVQENPIDGSISVHER